MDYFSLNYGEFMCLRNKNTQQYLHLNQYQDRFYANGLHTYVTVIFPHQIYDQFPKKSKLNHFKIINKRYQQYNGIISYGTQIYLKNHNNQYLLATPQGQLKLQKQPPDQTILLKTAMWTIIQPNNASSKKQMQFTDQFVLKCPFGNYMTLEPDSSVSASQSIISQKSTWKFYRSTIPYVPDWIYQRSGITKPVEIKASEFYLIKKDQKKPLSSFTLQVQEWNLIDDLLDVLIGFQGAIIKKKLEPNNIFPMYIVQPHLQSPSCGIITLPDQSLYQLILKILPLAQTYIYLTKFIQNNAYQSGNICKAFVGSLQGLLKQYLMMITQLDEQFAKGILTLQKLWYIIQPTMNIFQFLMKIVRQIQRLKGGNLLTCLYDLINTSTDQKINKISIFLLNKSILPYIQILEKWIYQGLIDDPYTQFMVKENRTQENIKKHAYAHYWENRFVLNQQMIPSFLRKNAQTILLTGKYLNIIRQCDKTINNPFTDVLNLNYQKYLFSHDFSQPINQAYDWANNQLMNLIIKEKELFQRLKSIKGYFFLELGDFYIHFLDSAQQELQKKAIDASKDKLQSLLQLSIRTSTANKDRFKDDVSCTFTQWTISEQIYLITTKQNIKIENTKDKTSSYMSQKKMVDIFMLDYKVEWPLNLIFSKKSILTYQVLFKFLFQCKYTQRMISNTFVLHQYFRKLEPLKLLTRAHLVSNKMIHYIKNLIYYLCYEVFEHNWTELQQNLKKAKRFEDILNYHDKFLNACLKQSMLMEHSIYQLISKLNFNCKIFSQTMKKIVYDSKQVGEKIEKNYKEEPIRHLLNDLRTFLLKSEQEFDQKKSKLYQSIKKLGNNSDKQFNNLLIRLDLQEYYNNVNESSIII